MPWFGARGAKLVPTSPPVLVAATVQGNGTSFILSFDQAVTFGAGGNSGLTATLSGGAATLTYASGATTSSLTYTLSRTVNIGETGTLAYTQPGNGIESQIGAVDKTTFSGFTITNSSSQSSGPVTLAQDWINRSTLSGIEKAIVWEDSTTYFGSPSYVDPSLPARVQWFPDDGILGNGCLHFEIKSSDGANSGAWRHPFNLAGAGTDLICVQWRTKFGPNRFVEEPPGTDGNKVIILGGYNSASPASSRSHVNNEEVVQFYGQQHAAGENTITAYRDLSQGGVGAFPEWFAGTSNSYQNAVDNGSGISDPLLRFCRYDPTKPDSLSDGCVQLKENVWYTFQVERQIVTPGGTTGNIWRLRIAGPTDSTWTTLIDLNNVLMPLNSNDALDFTSNGPTTTWLLPYKTSRGANPNGWDSYQRYDQLLVRRGDVIPCPAPRTVPSFANPGTTFNWASISGTQLDAVDPSPSLYAGNQGPLAKLDEWGGFGFDPARNTIAQLRGGGHFAYSGNEVDTIDMKSATPAWVELRGPSWPVTNAAYYADGRPVSIHTYYSTRRDNRAKRWFSLGGSKYSDGNYTNGFNAFLDSTNDWVASGTLPVTPSQLTSSGAQALGTCEDPRTGDLYLFGNNYIFKWVYGASSWTQMTNSAPVHGERMATAFDTKRQNILCIGGINTTYPGKHTYKFGDNTTLTELTFTGAEAGTIANAIDMGLVYVEHADYFVAAIANAGCPLYKIVWVNNTTYNVTALTTTGGSSIPAHVKGSCFNRIIYSPMDRGLYYTARCNNPMWFLKLDG